MLVGQITADLLFGRIEENHGVDGSSDLGDLPLEIKVGIGLFDQIEGVAVRRIEQFFDRAEAGIVIFRMLGTGRQCKTREQQNNQFIQYVFHRFNYFLADDLDYMRTILHVTGHNQGDIDFLTVKIAVELKLFGTIGIPGKQILGQNVILHSRISAAGAAVVAFRTGPYIRNPVENRMEVVTLVESPTLFPEFDVVIGEFPAAVADILHIAVVFGARCEIEFHAVYMLEGDSADIEVELDAVDTRSVDRGGFGALVVQHAVDDRIGRAVIALRADERKALAGFELLIEGKLAVAGPAADTGILKIAAALGSFCP